MVMHKKDLEDSILEINNAELYGNAAYLSLDYKNGYKDGLIQALYGKGKINLGDICEE